MTGLKVLDLIGVFYRQDGHLMVADEFEGAQKVATRLESLVGHEVRLLAHHRPTEPPDRTRWGGGCCHLENTGECPWGHHDNPDTLFMYNGHGVLRIEGDQWFLEKEDGSKQEIRTHFLEAHRSQIVVTSIPNLEQINEKVRSFDPSKLENANIDELTDQLGQIRDMLEQIHSLQKNIDV